MPQQPAATPRERPQAQPASPIPAGQEQGRGSALTRLSDWQAALAVTVTLFLIAETEAAPVAHVIAWGAALGYVLWAMNTKQGGGLSWAALKP